MALGFLTTVAVIAGGCAAESVALDEDDTEYFEEIDDALIQRVGGRVSATKVLEDEDIEGDQNVTVAQVQALLDESRSSLRDYSVGGRTAAEVIVTQALASRISPIYMLARLQTEQGLVFAPKSGRALTRALNKAMGCGCPDYAPCSRSNVGFEGQVVCGAKLVRVYLDNLDKGLTTAGGSAYIQPKEWKLGKTTRTLDGCYIRPENRATAALYTYTPWVGQSSTSSCGARQHMGTSGLAIQYKKVKLNVGPLSGSFAP